MTKSWRIEPRFREHPVAELLPSYEATEKVAVNRGNYKPWADCQTFPVDVAGKRFFIKYYRHNTAWWRAILRSRPRRERRNLHLFESLGVPTTPLAAYGEFWRFGVYGKGGIVVTEGLDGCIDMHRLGEEQPQLFADRAWFARLSNRLAELVRRIHDAGFFHNDLNWRNVLVRPTGEFEVYLFDSPSGRRWPGPLQRFRRIKDLAHLDKLGRRYLRQTQRLRFYLRYVERERLLDEDKTLIRDVLARYHDSHDQAPRNIYHRD